MRVCMQPPLEFIKSDAMKTARRMSLAEKADEARKNSVLLRFAYHTTPTKGRMLAGQHGHVRPELLAIFEELVESAAKYKRLTGRHLPILGELGELFAEIMFGLKRHGPMTRGSDGKLDDELVEVKTITPEKSTDSVQVNQEPLPDAAKTIRGSTAVRPRAGDRFGAPAGPLERRLCPRRTDRARKTLPVGTFS